MNEQTPPAPPRRRPPPSADGRPRPPRPRPSPPPSKESRFVGYLVLGFGILAVIAVLILAFGGSNKEVAQRPEAPKPPDARNVAADLSPITMPEAQSEPEPKTDLFFERDAGFKADKMEGDWQAAIGNYTAVLQIRKNVYQLILASGSPGAPRLYSSGTYQVAEDIIILNPRLDWPAPAVAAGKNISYSKLTRARFPVIARFDGDKMLWQNTPQAEIRVSGPYNSPIFMSEDVKVAVWKRLK